MFTVSVFEASSWSSGLGARLNTLSFLSENSLLRVVTQRCPFFGESVAWRPERRSRSLRRLSDYQLDSFLLVICSTPRLSLNLANFSAFCQLGFLICWVIWLFDSLRWSWGAQKPIVSVISYTHTRTHTHTHLTICFDTLNFLIRSSWPD